ncbi:hypothetical protein LTR37_001157 [Vermiconidia calcicola]|uniref:Uncharacterized protein n=1 Tax=Vermiconidia calcicola TaxID=1690605 RepID=A0ACC3NX04_9PEZI|nr:hypothetical protein LTR37_001157 [Vermiconidia calcicola]
MDAYATPPRPRPSNLTVPCHNCGVGVSYSPYNVSGLCRLCRGGVPLDQEANNAIPDWKHMNHGYEPPASVTPPANLKRKADTPLERGGSRGRAFTNDFSANSRYDSMEGYGGSVGYDRINSNFGASPYSSGHMFAGLPAQTDQDQDMSSDEDEDEFVDAQEEVGPESGAITNKKAASEGQVDEDGDLVTEKDGTEMDVDDQDVAEGEDGGTEVYGDEEEEQDLFGKTFGSSSASAGMDEDGDEDEDEEEDEAHGGQTKQQPNVVNKQPTSRRRTKLEGFDKSEHARGCTNTHTPSTPRDSPRAISPALLGPDPIKDLSPNLKRLKYFHARAIELIPRLPLAAHRYWIGVLNLDVNPKTFSKEEHFTWMKGNRFTTIETVWHMYQQTTVSENFSLLCGFEKVEMKVRMEELEYFGDKKVMLRAVHDSSAEAEGRELCEGVVPKEKVVATEVIEID